MKCELSELEKSRLEWYLNSQGERLLDDYWLAGGDVDQGLNYCKDCVIKKIQMLEKTFPDETFYLMEGFGYESDSTTFCDDCNEFLNHTLTSYGCSEEVTAFSKYGNIEWIYNKLECRLFLIIIESSDWQPFNFENKEDYELLISLCREILDRHFWIMPYKHLRYMWE